jgi:hypothetical protein
VSSTSLGHGEIQQTIASDFLEIKNVLFLLLNILFSSLKAVIPAGPG